MKSLRQILVASAAGLSLSLAVIGCQPDHPDIVPSSAQLQSSGNGMIRFTAANDGTAYVYDKPTSRLLWSGHVSQGQTVTIDPGKNEILLDSQPIASRTLVAGDVTEVYFAASPTPAPVAPMQQPQQQSGNYSNSNYNNGLTVTPSVTVQPNNGNGAAPGSVTVQPGLSVTPATQPSNP